VFPRARSTRLLLALGATLAAAPAGGEEPESAPVAPPEREAPARRVQEIIVTAQKKEEAAIDVPVSVSVLDDEFITEQGIADLQELSSFVPNVNIRLSPVLPDIRIRGFGTGTTNKAFEQSVGLVIDGVPYNRLPYYGAGLFDLERIEVLRGPQGTLFGKNTIAGLFNMIPKDPTDEYTGSVDLQYGELDRRRAEAAVGGPLVRDFVNFRLAGLVELRDGFVRNTTAEIVPEAHERLQGYDRHQFRGRARFPSLLGTSLLLSYDWFEIDATGLGAELKVVPQSTRPFFREFDPKADFEPNNYVASVDHPDGSLSNAHTGTANWHGDVGDWGVDFVGGHSVMRIEADLDVDYSPAPAAVITTADDNTTTSLELRTTSPSLPGFLGLRRLFGFDLGNSDFIAGVFHQRRTIENSFLTLDIDPVVFGEFVARQRLPIALPPLPNPVPGRGVISERSTLVFDETSESIAGFGQMNWNFVPRWTVLFGLRLQNEKKQADWIRTFDSPTSLIFTQFLNWAEFTQSLERSEFQVSPKVSLNYKPTDDLSFFARWSRGYKGGGFNEFATRGSASDLQFAQEEVDEWALDAKTMLLDDTARLNVSLFWMELSDFQVLTTRPGDIVFTVVNAAKARARGVEADLTILPTSWLSVIGTLGFNDAKFLEFPIGTCAQDMPNTDGDSDPRCDLSGHSLARAPHWVISMMPVVTLPVTSIPGLRNWISTSWSGLGFSSSFTVEYQDSQDTEGLGGLGDPRARQEPFFRYRASLGIGNPDQGWSVRLAVENLTNVATQNGTGEIQTAPGHIWQQPEPPRVVYGQLRWVL
jgi:outer membrane receptor protein involved in Fe transport